MAAGLGELCLRLRSDPFFLHLGGGGSERSCGLLQKPGRLNFQWAGTGGCLELDVLEFLLPEETITSFDILQQINGKKSHSDGFFL